MIVIRQGEEGGHRLPIWPPSVRGGGGGGQRRRGGQADDDDDDDAAATTGKGGEQSSPYRQRAGRAQIMKILRDCSNTDAD